MNSGARLQDLNGSTFMKRVCRRQRATAPKCRSGAPAAPTSRCGPLRCCIIPEVSGNRAGHAVRLRVVRSVALALMLATSLAVASCGGPSADKRVDVALESETDTPPSTVGDGEPEVEQLSAEPTECPDVARDSEEDIALEPDYSADYLHRWTNSRGCPVRLDVLMTRVVRDGACGPEDDILMGTPLGVSSQSSVSSVRIYGGSGGSIDRDAQLPPSAAATGYSQGEYELWMNSSDDSSLFLVYADHVERWALAANPPVCG